MKIVYTESALDELERFQSQRKEELELFLKRDKYVFGDDEVEITASDIREAAKKFRVSNISQSKLPITNMLLKVYMLIGAAMVLSGLFYPELKRIVQESPEQLILIIGGVALSLASFFGSYYFKIRTQRSIILEAKVREYESRKRADL